VRFIWPCSNIWLAVKMKRNGRPQLFSREVRETAIGRDKIRPEARICTQPIDAKKSQPIEAYWCVSAVAVRDQIPLFNESASGTHLWG